MIDTQALRSKILDLAMRGKLTEQLPEDGTAEELYQQIQAEKQMLIKTGKIKKEKPLPESAMEDIPFNIPSNWIWVRLSSISKKITDGTHNSPINTLEGEFMYVTAKNIKDDGVVFNDITYVTKSIHEEIYTRCNPEKGDVLLIKDGATTGIVTVNNVSEPFSMLSSVALIKPMQFIDPWYIVYTMRSSWFYRYVRNEMTGVGITRVVLRQIQTFTIPLPPLAEQKRIVERIDQVFSVLDTIATLQAKYADNLTVLKSKLIDAAIQGKLTEQLPEDGTAEELYQQIQKEKQVLIKAGKIKQEKPLPEILADEIPFEIPSNWKWVRLGSIGITFTGGTPSKTHPEYYGGNYPFFKPSDLDAGRHITKASEYLTEKGKEVSRQLQKNSILVCCIGSIGKAAIIDTDGTANQQINALTPLACNSDYLLYAISSGALQHQLDQGSRATTVSIINKSKFDNCILPLPPLAEQKRIVMRLQEAFRMIGT